MTRGLPIRLGTSLMLLGAAPAAAAQMPDNSARPGLDWLPLAALLDSAVAAGAAPGAVVGVSLGGIHYLHGAGRLGLDDPTRPGPETVYDLASLTKVIGLTTAVMLAVTEGRLELDGPVQRYLPSFTGAMKERVTIRHLLTHSSGLRDHRRLWIEAPDRASALALVDSTPLDTVPGTRTVYSDLGAIVLTRVIERIYGSRIDSLLSARVFQPLGMRGTRYLPPRDWLPRIAPTEWDPWRGRMLHGEVHDENGGRLEGISGHAGLFSTASDLLVFGETMVDLAQDEPKAECRLQTADCRWPASANPSASCNLRSAVCPRLAVQPSVAREFVRRQNVVANSSRALGWDTPSPNSSAGTRLSPQSFGHTGFTGTSVWIDPTRELVIVLLSNRVHPTRENSGHIALRKAVADMTVTIVDASSLVDM